MSCCIYLIEKSEKCSDLKKPSPPKQLSGIKCMLSHLWYVWPEFDRRSAALDTFINGLFLHVRHIILKAKGTRKKKLCDTITLFFLCWFQMERWKSTECVRMYTYVFTCVCVMVYEFCMCMCMSMWTCERSAGAGPVSGLGTQVCVPSPVCSRPSQCGAMSAVSLFSRQGSRCKHTHFSPANRPPQSRTGRDLPNMCHYWNLTVT